METAQQNAISTVLRRLSRPLISQKSRWAETNKCSLANTGKFVGVLAVVRELIHRIERAVIMDKGQYIDLNDLGLEFQQTKESNTLKELKEEVEKKTIIQALISSKWNITRSSKELGISRWTLHNLIKKYNITRSNT